jgi:hypothetical protein
MAAQRFVTPELVATTVRVGGSPVAPLINVRVTKTAINFFSFLSAAVTQVTQIPLLLDYNGSETENKLFIIFGL